jgi:hypothetical protein
MHKLLLLVSFLLMHAVNPVFAVKVKIISVPEVDTTRPLTALEADAAFAKIGEYAYNPIKMSQPGTFGTSQAGVDLERYMAHPDFNKLGASLFRDNEDYYNKNGTPGADFIRALNCFLAFPVGLSIFVATIVFLIAKYLLDKGKIKL